MATSSTSTRKSTGYIMRDTKFGAYYTHPESGVQVRMVHLGESGSPSEMWSRIRVHLGFNEHLPVSFLKVDGYRVKALPEVRDSPPVSFAEVDNPPSKTTDWSFWFGLASFIILGAVIGALL